MNYRSLEKHSKTVFFKEKRILTDRGEVFVDNLEIRGWMEAESISEPVNPMQHSNLKNSFKLENNTAKMIHRLSDPSLVVLDGNLLIASPFFAVSTGERMEIENFTFSAIPVKFYNASELYKTSISLCSLVDGTRFLKIKSETEELDCFTTDGRTSVLKIKEIIESKSGESFSIKTEETSKRFLYKKENSADRVYADSHICNNKELDIGIDLQLVRQVMELIKTEELTLETSVENKGFFKIIKKTNGMFGGYEVLGVLAGLLIEEREEK